MWVAWYQLRSLVAHACKTVCAFLGNTHRVLRSNGPRVRPACNQPVHRPMRESWRAQGERVLAPAVAVVQSRRHRRSSRPLHPGTPPTQLASTSGSRVRDDSSWLDWSCRGRHCRYQARDLRWGTRARRKVCITSHWSATTPESSASPCPPAAATRPHRPGRAPDPPLSGLDR